MGSLAVEKMLRQRASTLELGSEAESHRQLGSQHSKQGQQQSSDIRILLCLRDSKDTSPTRIEWLKGKEEDVRIGSPTHAKGFGFFPHGGLSNP